MIKTLKHHLELLHTMKKQLKIKPKQIRFFWCKKTIQPPSYFEYIPVLPKIQYGGNYTKMDYNPKGRFYVGKGLHIDQTNKINEALKIGFEEPKRAILFFGLSTFKILVNNTS